MVGKGMENRIMKHCLPAYCVAAPREQAVSWATQMLSNNQLLTFYSQETMTAQRQLVSVTLLGILSQEIVHLSAEKL